MLSWFVVSFFLAIIFSRPVIILARRFNFIDQPTGETKKIHRQPVPLLGGLAIYAAVFIPLVILLWQTDVLTFGLMDSRHFVGYLLGGIILIVGGALDDKFNLPPRVTIFFPLLAATASVIFGIGVSKLSNPFGEPIGLLSWQSEILTFVWLMVVMYTTKLLDGLDGLATSVTLIGAVMIALLALSSKYFQPDAALFAVIVAGALAGFLVWNFHPARLFLGEGGGTFVGFTLGVLAVIAGSKLGIALLVISVPLLDVVWIVGRRILIEHKPPWVGDRQHLHHRLLDLGLSHRTITALYVAIAALAGTATFFIQGQQKLALFVLIALMLILAAFWLTRTRRFP